MSAGLVPCAMKPCGLLYWLRWELGSGTWMACLLTSIHGDAGAMQSCNSEHAITQSFSKHNVHASSHDFCHTPQGLHGLIVERFQVIIHDRRYGIYVEGAACRQTRCRPCCSDRLTASTAAMFFKCTYYPNTSTSGVGGLPHFSIAGGSSPGDGK